MNLLPTSNDTWSVPISKLMIHIDNKWIPYVQQNKVDSHHLRVHYDQIFIIQNDKILERIGGKIKFFYKDNIFILVYCGFNNKMRKFKFQLQNPDTEASIQKLTTHFPVVHHKQLPTVVPVTFKNVGEILKESMTLSSLDKESQDLSIPSHFEDFIKVCLLDPSFPHFVAQTDKLLNNITSTI